MQMMPLKNLANDPPEWVAYKKSMNTKRALKLLEEFRQANQRSTRRRRIPEIL